MFNRQRHENSTVGSTTYSQQQQQQSATNTTTTLFGRPIQNSIRQPSTISRQEHIDSYIGNPQLAPSTRKQGDDDSTFDTVFQSVSGDTLILRVHWPPTVSGMIVRPPAMTLAGVEARHSWIDSRMRIIGYEPIQSSDAWLKSNILLGVAVHTVIQHLQLNPPTILRFVDVGLSSIQQSRKKQTSNGGNHRTSTSPPPPPAYHESMIQSASNSRQRSISPKPPSSSATIPNNIHWPTIPPYFHELDSLSRERMEEILQNEKEFKAFVKQLPIMEEYNKIQQEQQLNQNAMIAKSNLQYENEMTTLYDNVVKLQKELQEKVQIFQTYETEQDTILQPPPIHTVVRELQKAKKDAYQQSEHIAEQWLLQQQSQNNNNNQSLSSSFELSQSTMNSSNTNHQSNHVQQFIDEFMKVRKIQHLRAAKLEILERTHGTNIKKR